MLQAVLLTGMALGLLSAVAAAQPSTQPRRLLNGADISMLPALEGFGAVYHDYAGQPADAIRVLRQSGMSLFRIRLFVNPSKDFDRNWGAVQDIDSMIALAKRIRAEGGQILLDLHYSDTWADPAHQNKPAAWKDLPFDQLEKQVHDYTLEVLAKFDEAGVSPEMIQVGNEIAPGMLWPDGALYQVSDPEARKQQWVKFGRLLKAGCSAARAHAARTGKPLKIILHAHGGGQRAVVPFFFQNVTAQRVDFDIMAVSFYPQSGETLELLRQNLETIARAYKKDVLIVEVASSWRDAPTPEAGQAPPPWPATIEGQAACVSDLNDLLRALPEQRGLGQVWWYPEAIRVGGKRIWRDGAMALWDDQAKPLPAMKVLGEGTR